MDIYSIPGEIVAAERTLYRSLTEAGYRGNGAIVEVGALVGASSACLADGLEANTTVPAIRKFIHVFDRFEVYPHLAENFFPANGIHGYKVGDSFLPEYEANVAPWAKMLVVKQADAFDIKWDGGPIEILFIDCAISAAAYQHFIDTFYPHLIHGALIIDQDFFYQMAPWLPMKAAMMDSDIVTTVDSTAVTAFNDTDELPRIIGVPLLDQLRYLAQMAAQLPEPEAVLVRIQMAVAEFMAGAEADAKARMLSIMSRRLGKQASYRASMAWKMMHAK